jgi:hypothetical protein
MDRATLALASEATYSMLGSKNKTERLMNANNAMMGTGFTAIDSKSNRDILFLENDDKKEIIIAHRGTDITGFKTSPDLKSDFLISIGQEEQGKDFRKRTSRTKNLVKEIPADYKVYLTGHSYGGSSVNETLKGSKLVRDRVDNVATFNSGFSPFSKKGVGKDTEEKLKNKVIHYRVDGDIVSESIRVNKPFGKIKEYKAKQSVLNKIGKKIPSPLQPIFQTQDLLNRHKITNFY